MSDTELDCHDCKHCYPQKHTDALCRRYPPVYMGAGGVRFPAVQAKDKCGEFDLPTPDGDKP